MVHQSKRYRISVILSDAPFFMDKCIEKTVKIGYNEEYVIMYISKIKGVSFVTFQWADKRNKRMAIGHYVYFDGWRSVDF